MQRNYFRGLLICLIPCLLAGVYAFRLDKYRLGIDLAGGTILVYEINLERTKLLNADSRRDNSAGPANEGLAGEEMVKLAAQIKRRIDPADLKNVTVRPLGNTRVEIILPTGGSGGTRSNLTTEEIEEVKRLISQMGVLEFRILANEADDEIGVRAARDLIDNTNPVELDALATQGLPPPNLTEKYTVVINETPAEVRYAWVELGPEERASLQITNEDQLKGSQLWNELAGKRNKAVVHTNPIRGEGGRGGVSSFLIYSRDTKNTLQLEKEEKDRARLEQEGKLADLNAKKVDYFILTRLSPLDQVKIGGEVTLNASADQDRNMNPAIKFSLSGGGAQQFSRMTERNKPTGQTYRNLAVVLDERVISAPTLNSALPGGGQITGPPDRGLDQKYVNKIVLLLRNGALNAQLREKPVSENTIGPTLGEDTIRKGTLAVGLAFAAVLVFMLAYYRFAGMVACVALLANLVLTIGFMVGVHAAFTLPGLAGVVLMLGMAVDANVLIYERLREERNKGANLATAIRNGYEHAFPTIIDTHLSSIFTAIVLYTFGNDQLKGFAISLTVGLVISLFTSLYMTRLMFDYWLHRRWLTELRMMRLFERPAFNPMKYRFPLFVTTAILTVLGLALFVSRGDAGLNVDFRGGTVYAGRLKDGQERAMTTRDGQTGLRDLLGEANQRARLNVESVRWVNRPATGQDITALNVYEFEITYADKLPPATVALSQKPEGATEKEMEESVAARARHLPDASVEQMFLSTEPDFGNGRSRYFTVRTTERQPDIVQAVLDRLLRGDTGESLVASTDMSYPTRRESVNGKDEEAAAVTGPAVELSFDRFTSPNQLRSVLAAQFRNASADDGQTSFDLVPVGEGDAKRYKTLRLDVSKNAKFAALRQKAEADAAAAAALAGGPGRAAIIGSAALAATPPAIAAPNAADVTAQVRTLQDILKRTEQTVETRPEPERLEVFDSQLASETRMKALSAILASWAVILVYLWFRFGNWTFGLAAVLCLVHDLCFTLGAIALCHYLFDNPFGQLLRLEDFKIDLPAVAALLTLVGYSVNDTIVVFDRIREVRGKNPTLTPGMINDSVNQTLSRTVLASLTVFLVVSVLYVFGGEGVHLFAFVMVVGVVVGTYSSIFVAAPLLLLFGEGHAATEAVETVAPRAEEREVVEG